MLSIDAGCHYHYRSNLLGFYWIHDGTAASSTELIYSSSNMFTDDYISFFHIHRAVSFMRGPAYNRSYGT